ncbi:hypothetical protein [Halalkalibacter alkalisediminis]|uniref:IDEAL domain-containing protein n=1 Tax=Halalkalibacter alkalisediminis TaxID=935616 RepID=A0ABV6NHD2_9BACI|nr:hypothetical protein [Halalkalibacter alkalisediminis]
MRFFARFSNIYLEVNLSMIYTFLKQIKETYSYKWVRKTDYRVLIIFGDENYELPFREKDSKVFLSIQELTTNDRTFALTLNQLLFKARKKQLEIPTIKEKRSSRTKKINHDQLTRNKNLNKKDQKKQVTLSNINQPTEYAIQSEIDYLLMDLYEAMQIQDEERMSWCKERLQEMIRLKGNEIH